MPFLPPNQQRQSTEGKGSLVNQWEILEEDFYMPDVLPGL